MDVICNGDEDCEEDINTIDFAVATVLLNETLRITRASRGRGEAASVEPARKRRSELLASLAKRRRVESPSGTRVGGGRPNMLVMNIRQQLDVLDMNLEKNNELVEFHQQQVTRYLEESILWERRLNAVEEEIEGLLDKKRRAGKIKEYQVDFARYVYLGNHHGHSADLRRAGIISCSDDVDDDDIGRARGA